MREISDELKERIKNGTKYVWNITMYGKAGASISEYNRIKLGHDADIKSIEYNAASCGEQFGIGSFPASTFHFTLPLDKESNIDWKKFKFKNVDNIVVELLVLLKDDLSMDENLELMNYYKEKYGDRFTGWSSTHIYEVFQMGTFYINSVAKENDTIVVKCYDAAIKFDTLLYDQYFDALKTAQKDGQTKMPIDAFIISILKETGISEHIDTITEEQMGELSNIEYNGTTEPGVLPSEISISQALKLRGKTCREILMQFCEAYGCFCYIAGDFLRFKQYENNYIDEITEDEMFSFEYDGTIELTGVKEVFTKADNDTSYDLIEAIGRLNIDGDKKIELLKGGPGAVLNLSDENTLIISEYARLDSILSNQNKKYFGIQFTPCTITALPNPSYEIGDLIKVTDYWGIKHNVYITSVTFRDNMEMEIVNAGNDEFAFIDEETISWDFEDNSTDFTNWIQKTNIELEAIDGEKTITNPNVYASAEIYMPISDTQKEITIYIEMKAHHEQDYQYTNYSSCINIRNAEEQTIVSQQPTAEYMSYVIYYNSETKEASTYIKNANNQYEYMSNPYYASAYVENFDICSVSLDFFDNLGKLYFKNFKYSLRDMRRELGISI